MAVVKHQAGALFGRYLKALCMGGGNGLALGVERP